MDRTWEVFAIKYAEFNNRVRSSNFLFEADHDSEHPIDCFVWVLMSGSEIILVDTGFDLDEAKRRSRPILREPQKALGALGISPEDIKKVIITHLHFDHAGSLKDFPNAKFYLQSAEIAFATGPCMCEDILRVPYTGEHICDIVRHLYSGKVIFSDGDMEISPGVTVHSVGGHSRGLQAVRVNTKVGRLCLASDASHFYENFMARKPFPIVVDLQDAFKGYDKIQSLATEKSLVIPGHDPLISRIFPIHERCDFVWRLDVGEREKFQTLTANYT